MKIDKEKLLAALKADLASAEELKRDIDAKISERRRTYEGAPYGNEEKNKSKIVPKVAKRQSEWAHASLKDPFVSTPDIVVCTPITAEDVAPARQNELLLNTQFCRQFDRYNFMTKALKVLDVDGTLIVQTGWEYAAEEIEVEREVVKYGDDGSEYIVLESVIEKVVTKNQPTARVCRSEDVYVDPTCQDDLSNAQFVIYRYETDISTLKKDGRYRNLDKVAKTYQDDVDYEAEDKTEFRFQDEARKKMVVYEYWGNYDINDDGEVEPIVCTWIGDTVIRLQENPYPDKQPPFIVVPYSSIPFQLHGENNMDLISDHQMIITAITRGLINNMAQSTNGVVGIRKGALDPAQRAKFFKGENFEFNNSPADFWQGSYNQIPGSAFDMLKLQNNEVESLTGIKGFSGGLTGAGLGNMLDINTDVPLIDGTFKKLAHIVDGDQLVGSDGKATTVLKAHKIKYPEIAYDMEFDNGSIVKSGGEHLWTVKVYGTKHKLREWTTMSADEVYAHVREGRRVVIPRIQEVHTGTPTNNTINPYVLGYWLGDGNSHSARITTEDTEVLEFFAVAGYTCVEVKDSSKCGNAKMYDVYKTGEKPQRDPVTKQFVSTGSLHSELRSLGLHARYGGEKHIPEEYFTATYEEKMELIRGLMDSDGYAHSGSFVQFSQSEGRLKNDVIKLIESLGLKANIITRGKDKRNSEKLALCERTGAKMVWQRHDSYEIGFTPWSVPFKLTRKASKWSTPRIQTVNLKVMKIVDKVLMRCLTVDSADKLFAVTDKYTLTHNTATGVRGVLDATSVRRLDLVRNIAENLIKPLMRKWMAYNAEFLSEEQVVRITNEEFIPIRRDDLAGNIDIDISISTAEDNANKSAELSFLLQTLGNSVPFELTQMLLAKMAKLSRMPDLEQQLLNYKPQPDPMAEKMKELELRRMELELEKMAAEIRDKNARAGENEVDRSLKMAKAQVEAAKARALTTKADLDDLKFIKEDEGVAHRERMELEEQKRLAALDQMAFQARMGDTNIGIK